ncbi:MAG: hypothetical protein H7831_12575 [Magnetococcus sp. WYHC-3]
MGVSTLQLRAMLMLLGLAACQGIPPSPPTLPTPALTHQSRADDLEWQRQFLALDWPRPRWQWRDLGQRLRHMTLWRQHVEQGAAPLPPGGLWPALLARHDALMNQLVSDAGRHLRETAPAELPDLWRDYPIPLDLSALLTREWPTLSAYGTQRGVADRVALADALAPWMNAEQRGQWSRFLPPGGHGGNMAMETALQELLAWSLAQRLGVSDTPPPSRLRVVDITAAAGEERAFPLDIQTPASLPVEREPGFLTRGMALHEMQLRFQVLAARVQNAPGQAMTQASRQVTGQRLVPHPQRRRLEERRRQLEWYRLHGTSGENKTTACDGLICRLQQGVRHLRRSWQETEWDQELDAVNAALARLPPEIEQTLSAPYMFQLVPLTVLRHARVAYALLDGNGRPWRQGHVDLWQRGEFLIPQGVRENDPLREDILAHHHRRDEADDFASAPMTLTLAVLLARIYEDQVQAGEGHARVSPTSEP